MNRNFSCFIGLFLGLMAVFSSAQVWSQNQGLQKPQNYEQAKQILTSVFDEIRVIRQQMTPGRFELDFITEQIGRDPERLYSFVRDYIAYQAYAGVLRGTKGTLAGEAGNSLDQTVLLYSLLNQVGIETRFAYAHLDEGAARRLITSMNTPSRRAKALIDHNVAKRLLELMPGAKSLFDAQGISKAIEEKSAAFDKGTQKSIQWLGDIYPVAADATHPTPDADLLADASEHYWLQYRNFEGRWIDLDPTVSTHAMGDVISVASTTFEAIDASLYHRLKIDITITRFDKENPTQPAQEEVVLSEELVSAGVFGKVVRLRNIPKNDIWSNTNSLMPGGKVDDVNSFAAALIVDEDLRLGRVFDLDGTTTDSFPISVPQGEAMDAMSNALGGLFGPAPDEVVEPEPTTALTGYRLDFTLSGPGASTSTRTFTRHVIDPREITAWSAQGASIENVSQHDDLHALRLDLLETTEIFILGGPVNANYANAKTLDQLLSMEVMLRQEIAKAWSVEDSEPLPAAKAGPELLGFAVERTAFIDRTKSSFAPDQLAYQAAMGLVLKSKRMSTSTEGVVSIRQTIDIVSNTTRITGGSAQSASKFARSLGIFDTKLERASVEVPNGQHFGADIYLTEAISNGTGFQTLTPDSQGLNQLEALSLPAKVALDIAADLNSGYTALVPRTVSNPERWAWLRVDPLRGTTLGMIPGPSGDAAESSELQSMATGFDAFSAKMTVIADAQLLQMAMMLGATVCWITNQNWDDMSAAGGIADGVMCASMVALAWPSFAISTTAQLAAAAVLAFLVWLTP